MLGGDGSRGEWAGDPGVVGRGREEGRGAGALGAMWGRCQQTDREGTALEVLEVEPGGGRPWKDPAAAG